MTNEEDLVLIEPYRKFEVIDSGIHRTKERSSIVPLKMEGEGELIYEKEIEPNISDHVIKALRNGIDDAEVVKRMLNIISKNSFDIGSNETGFIHFFFFKLHPLLFITDDTKENFLINEGIEFVMECYKKHNCLVKEVIYSFANVLNNDTGDGTLYFHIH